ncbi:MAG: M35 family metallo-endopeptidase [Bacteroidota bacterium]|nr:M35 family metallo-endopeptidase [Bacteroidota bacterium]
MQATASYKNNNPVNNFTGTPFFQRKGERNFFKDPATSFFKPGSAKPSAQIQLAPGDKHDLTATQLSGDTILEKTFDNEAIIGKFANSKGPHVKKIQDALIQLGIALPVSGADEKFGTETETGVKEFQQKASMSPKEQDGIVGRKTIGLLDRSLRNNSISTDTDVAQDDFTVKDEKKDEACKNKPLDQSCPDPNADVNGAADEAIKMIEKVEAEQLPPVKNKKADYPQIFDTIFRNNDTRDVSFKVTEVRTIYDKVKDFIGTLKTNKKLVRCATECDGGCRSGSPAYHTPTKAGSVITFCPDFNKHKDRILIVIHESHHASIPGSTDIAYNETRLFDKLDHTKALLNAASFHVYAAWVDSPGSESIGQKIKDTNLINDKAQKTNVDMSLAFMDQWFKLVPFDVSQTVQGTEEAKEKGKYIQHNAEVFMERVFSKWFGLTAPPTVPNSTDIKKLRAIEEHIKLMEDAFKAPFVILETKDQSFWSTGPGSDIALNANVLKLDQDHMIISLLQELVHATPNISAEIEPLYVGTINDMRNLRSLDP